MNRERIKEEFRIAYRLGLENKSFDIDSAMLHIDPIIAENERAKELLKELEWSGENEWRYKLCPLCMGEKEFGHLSDCKLFQLISKGNK